MKQIETYAKEIIKRIHEGATLKEISYQLECLITECKIDLLRRNTE